MSIKSYFAIATLFLVGCSTTNKKDNSVLETEKINNVSSDSIKLNSKNEEVNKNHLIGTWFQNANENSLFSISNDSITYTENLISYPYQLNKDTLIVIYSDYINKSIIESLNDSIFCLKDIEDNSVNCLIKIRK